MDIIFGNISWFYMLKLSCLVLLTFVVGQSPADDMSGRPVAVINIIPSFAKNNNCATNKIAIIKGCLYYF